MEFVSLFAAGDEVRLYSFVQLNTRIIAFGQENVNFDKVKEAAIIACIDDFVNSLPMQYETKIGKSGNQLG